MKGQKRDMFINHSEEIKLRNENRKKKIANVYEIKKQQTNETKKILEEQKLFRENYLAEIAEQNHSRFKNIKKQRIEGKQKINHFLNQRKQYFKLENEKEMQNQEKIKNDRVEEINKLEKMEMTLIQKLQNTQTLQVKAYEKLESAISLPPQEFKKIYEEDFKNKSEINNKSVHKSHIEEENKEDKEKIIKTDTKPEEKNEITENNNNV